MTKDNVNASRQPVGSSAGNLLSVLILEPLKLLACLLVVRALTLKLRLKVAYLSLKARYIRFRIGKLILRKRKMAVINPYG